MLDLGFIEDVEKILRMCPSGRQTALFSATMPPPVKRLAESYMYDPTTISITPKNADRRRDRPGLHRGPGQREGGAAGRAAEDRGTRAGDHLLAAPKSAPRAREDAQGQRARRQGPARRPQPGRPRRRDDLLQGPPGAAAGRDRHRRPRARHRARHPRHQLRRPRLLGGLRAPHRPHRPGRPHRAARSPSSRPAQRDEIDRIERDVKTSIGEWESPEERLEHAPRPRRRERNRERPAADDDREACRGPRSRTRPRSPRPPRPRPTRPRPAGTATPSRRSSSSTAASAAASRRRTCAGRCARAPSCPRTRSTTSASSTASPSSRSPRTRPRKRSSSSMGRS